MRAIEVVGVSVLCGLVGLWGCKSSPEASPQEPSSSPATSIAAPEAAGATQPSSAATNRVYDENTAEIAAAVGVPFTLALPANVTTPYKWGVDPSTDASALELIKDEYAANPPAECTGCVGTGGRRLLTFQPKRAGTVQLSMSYRSITNAAEPPAKQYSARVVIR
jgi:predicted secreted protein